MPFKMHPLGDEKQPATAKLHNTYALKIQGKGEMIGQY